MALQPKRLALAAATTAIILYMLCWHFMALAPELSLQLTEDMFHGSLGAMTWRMDERSHLVGTVLREALAGLSVWMGAALYNGFETSPPETGDETTM